MKFMAFDLGLNVGYAIRQHDERPVAGSFRIPFRADQLGEIAQDFFTRAVPLIRHHKPDVLCRAMPIVNKRTLPYNIGPYYGLTMMLDWVAKREGIELQEFQEQDARGSFLGKVPRKSKDIKKAVIAECARRYWPAKDDHTCDAIVIALFAQTTHYPEGSIRSKPLFEERK